MNIHPDTHRVLAILASDMTRVRTSRFTKTKLQNATGMRWSEVGAHLEDLRDLGLVRFDQGGFVVTDEATAFLYENPLTDPAVSNPVSASRGRAREDLGLSKEGTPPTAPVPASRSSSRERTPLVKPYSGITDTPILSDSAPNQTPPPSRGRAAGPRTIALGRIEKSSEHSMSKPVGVARWFQERCTEVAVAEGAGRANDVSVARVTKHLKDWTATGVLLEDIVTAMTMFLEGGHFDVRSTYPAWSQFWYRRMDLLKAATEAREMQDWSEEEERYGPGAT